MTFKEEFEILEAVAIELTNICFLSTILVFEESIWCQYRWWKSKYIIIIDYSLIQTHNWCCIYI